MAQTGDGATDSKEKGVLFVGFWESGKSAAVSTLVVGVPWTEEFLGPVSYTHSGVKMTIWDADYESSNGWSDYFHRTDGLVFFVDSTDINTMSSAKFNVRNEMRRLCNIESLRGVPFAIACTRQESDSALSLSDIGREIGFDEMIDRDVQLFAVQMKSGSMIGLEAMMDWLTWHMNSDVASDTTDDRITPILRENTYRTRKLIELVRSKTRRSDLRYQISENLESWAVADWQGLLSVFAEVEGHNLTQLLTLSDLFSLLRGALFTLTPDTLQVEEVISHIRQSLEDLPSRDRLKSGPTLRATKTLSSDMTHHTANPVAELTEQCWRELTVLCDIKCQWLDEMLEDDENQDNKLDDEAMSLWFSVSAETRIRYSEDRESPMTIDMTVIPSFRERMEMMAAQTEDLSHLGLADLYLYDCRIHDTSEVSNLVSTIAQSLKHLNSLTEEDREQYPGWILTCLVTAADSICELLTNTDTLTGTMNDDDGEIEDSMISDEDDMLVDQKKRRRTRDQQRKMAELNSKLIPLLRFLVLPTEEGTELTLLNIVNNPEQLECIRASAMTAVKGLTLDNFRAKVADSVVSMTSSLVNSGESTPLLLNSLLSSFGGLAFKSASRVCTLLLIPGSIAKELISQHMIPHSLDVLYFLLDCARRITQDLEEGSQINMEWLEIIMIARCFVNDCTSIPPDFIDGLEYSLSQMGEYLAKILDIGNRIKLELCVDLLRSIMISQRLKFVIFGQSDHSLMLDFNAIEQLINLDFDNQMSPATINSNLLNRNNSLLSSSVSHRQSSSILFIEEPVLWMEPAMCLLTLKMASSGREYGPPDELLNYFQRVLGKFESMDPRIPTLAVLLFDEIINEDYLDFTAQAIRVAVTAEIAAQPGLARYLKAEKVDSSMRMLVRTSAARIMVRATEHSDSDVQFGAIQALLSLDRTNDDPNIAKELKPIVDHFKAIVSSVAVDCDLFDDFVDRAQRESPSVITKAIASPFIGEYGNPFNFADPSSFYIKEESDHYFNNDDNENENDDQLREYYDHEFEHTTKNNDQSNMDDDGQLKELMLALIFSIAQFSVSRWNTLLRRMIHIWESVLQNIRRTVIEHAIPTQPGTVEGLSTMMMLEQNEYSATYWSVNVSAEPISLALFSLLYLFQSPEHTLFEYVTGNRKLYSVWMDFVILCVSYMIKLGYDLFMGYRVIDEQWEQILHHCWFVMKELLSLLSFGVVLIQVLAFSEFDDFFEVQNVVLYYHLLVCAPAWMLCLWLPYLMDYFLLIHSYQRSFMRLSLLNHQRNNEFGAISSVLYTSGLNLGEVSLMKVSNLQYIYHLNLAFNVVINEKQTLLLVRDVLAKSDSTAPVTNILSLALWDTLIYTADCLSTSNRKSVPVINGRELNLDILDDMADHQSLVDFWALISLSRVKTRSNEMQNTLAALICTLSSLVKMNPESGQMMIEDEYLNDRSKSIEERMLNIYNHSGEQNKSKWDIPMCLDYWNNPRMKRYICLLFYDLQRQSNSIISNHGSDGSDGFLIDEDLAQKVERAVEIASVDLSELFGDLFWDKSFEPLSDDGLVQGLKQDPKLTEVTKECLIHLSRQHVHHGPVIASFLLQMLILFRSAIHVSPNLRWFWTVYPYGNSSHLVDYETGSVIPHRDPSVLKDSFRKYTTQHWILNRGHSHHTASKERSLRINTWMTTFTLR